jgi:hypothetical protein
MAAQQDANGGRRASYMKLEVGKVYNIRPVGSAKRFYQIYNPTIRKSVKLAVTDGQKAETVIRSLTGTELKGSIRYAINVIHRDDNNQIKIMEGPLGLFRAFAAWTQMSNGLKVGGMQGVEWQITPVDQGGSRIYTAINGQPSHFNEQQAEAVRTQSFDLERVIRLTPLDEVVSRLFPGVGAPAPAQQQGYVVAGGVPPVAAGGIQAPAYAPVAPVAPAVPMAPVAPVPMAAPVAPVGVGIALAAAPAVEPAVATPPWEDPNAAVAVEPAVAPAPAVAPVAAPVVAIAPATADPLGF